MWTEMFFKDQDCRNLILTVPELHSGNSVHVCLLEKDTGELASSKQKDFGKNT